MFTSARLKLTGWYLLIIMVISISFSAVIYRVLTYEVDRLLERQSARLTQQFNDPSMYPAEMRGNRFNMMLLDPELVDELKSRLIINLAFINGLILLGAGGLGFMLAGKTLQPIKVMIDEQNRFIADASHELRTPITALKTTLEVNLRDQSLSLKEARQILEANLEDVNRLQTLSNALLELAQYQKPPTATTSATTNVADAAKEAIKVVKPIATAKKITIKSNISAGEAAISSKELTDVLIILLDNALKYSPEKTMIDVTSTNHDGHLALKISDQGIGIAAKDLPHIFDRFYQVESSRSSKTRKGYGLGLAIAKQTIERNNGSISVASVLQTGTTFTLRLRAV